MMEKCQKLPYNGTLKEAGGEEEKKKEKKKSWRRSFVNDEEGSWKEIRFLAADRRGRSS
jgi:hypothetical protein